MISGSLILDRGAPGCKGTGASLCFQAGGDRRRAAAPRPVPAGGALVGAGLSLKILLAAFVLLGIAGEFGLLPLQHLAGEGESLLGSGVRALTETDIFALWTQLQTALIQFSADLDKDWEPRWVAALAALLTLSIVHGALDCLDLGTP